jgi:GxxExxY protein
MSTEDDVESQRAEEASTAQPMQTRHRLLHQTITRSIIGATYRVHDELGSGFLESVYVNALTVALRAAGMRAERQVPFTITFLGEPVGRYVADLIVDSRVVVEVKAARALDAAHLAQLLNYLRASGLRVGLLLNFGRIAQFRRVVSG